MSESNTNTSANANANRLLLVGTFADTAYLQQLKSCVGTASCAVILETPSTLYELSKIAEAKNVDAIISTSPALLYSLVQSQTRRKKPAIDNYAGSIFRTNGREVLFINPLEQLITVPYGKFITSRYISKLTNKANWTQYEKFNWELADPSNFDYTFRRYKDAIAIAIDIETFSSPLSIRCVGYTAIFTDGTFHSYVIPCDSTYNLTWIRKFNWELQAPKIFQNGKYDIAYLSMYNAVPYNYLWDTATLFHSWYSELPKDLASLNSFCVRDSMYWKDLADTSDLHTYYLYNAKDTYATACVWLSLMKEIPDWASQNYSNEFPLLFPCHLSEMTGIRRDTASLGIQCKEVELNIAEKSKSLDTMLAVKNFNVNSPLQMKQLLTVLGCKDLESADAKNLAKAKLRHPLNTRIINSIIEIRKQRKLVSTYLTPGKEFKGRILYALNPHGTDTGRLASKEHHFWCGLQVQNIPRGDVVKRTFIADDGFLIYEADYSAAETRGTGHLAGCQQMISNVEGENDFHSLNAAAFFGVPYETIYSNEKHKTINKELRDLAKRINHGANYLMGANVLVETMGEDKVLEAARLLKLPRLWSYKQIAEHLLNQFHKTYPELQRIFYPSVVHKVVTTKKLVGPTGLTRYCFGDPSKSKSALNEYVAHTAQSLNAMILNKAYMKVFYSLALDHSNDFKLLCQIHDSILFQIRKGHEHLLDKIKDCMVFPTQVTGADGKVRTMVVPVDISEGGLSWGAIK
jgi:DNA polymerase I-like protein with 3'-5' exonuclease and polymerase domains